jgi:hypothetical protein
MADPEIDIDGVVVTAGGRGIGTATARLIASRERDVRAAYEESIAAQARR